MDFINRETVCEKLNEIGGCDASDEWAKGYDAAIDEAINIVESLPASNAFEVVRCKDCMYYDCIENYCDRLGCDLPGDLFYCRDGLKTDE